LPERHVLDGIGRGTTLIRPPEGGPKNHGYGVIIICFFRVYYSETDG